MVCNGISMIYSFDLLSRAANLSCLKSHGSIAMQQTAYGCDATVILTDAQRVSRFPHIPLVTDIDTDMLTCPFPFRDDTVQSVIFSYNQWTDRPAKDA